MTKYLFFIPAILLIASCNKKIKVDLIIEDAVIYTVDNDMAVSQAMAVQNGKIVALGSNEEILKKFSSPKIENAQGKYIYPGFYDAHCHFYGYGKDLKNINLRGTSSFEEIVELLKTFAFQNPEGLIQGRGWDQNDWEVKDLPDNHLLNEYFPDRPVILTRIDGHAVIANEYALNMAGVTNLSVTERGEIVKKNGKLTGVLIDQAAGLVRQFIETPGKSDIISSLLMAQDACFSVGLTSLCDCGMKYNILKIIEELQKHDSLKIRIYANLSPSNENIENYMNNGIYKTDRLHVGAIKLFADGTLGSRGARLLEPYSDDPGNKGIPVSNRGYLEEMATLAYEHGYQVNTHCIGDAANREVLQIYSQILKGKNDRRWRIEHAQVVHPDDVKMFKEYSIIPSVQTTHATSDMYWADERLGERIKNAYIYKTLLEQNGWIPNGSDFPVEDINPIFGFYAGVFRKDHKGWPENGFQIDEALSREEALKAMTIWAAKACFEEAERGSLEPGKLADFVILNQDIMKAEPMDILSAKVLNTFINGEEVYSIPR